MARFRRSRPLVRSHRGRKLLLPLRVVIGASIAIAATVGYVSADHIHDRTGAPMPPPYGHVVIDPFTCFGPGIGYAYGPAPASTLLRPTFHDVTQRIRYIPESNVTYNGGRYRFGYTDGSNCDRYYGYQQVPEYPWIPPAGSQEAIDPPTPPLAAANAAYLPGNPMLAGLPPVLGLPGYAVADSPGDADVTDPRLALLPGNIFPPTP